MVQATGHPVEGVSPGLWGHFYVYAQSRRERMGKWVLTVTFQQSETLIDQKRKVTERSN